MRAPDLGPLASHNEALVEAEFGLDYVRNSKNDILDSRAVIEANNALADIVYGPEVSLLLRSRRIDQLNKMSEDNLHVVAQESDGLDRATAMAIGMVVLRPEVVEYKDAYRAFLETQGLAIVYERHSQISFAQYWGMYHHGLIHPDSYSDFPTRTLNYVGKPIYLMIATSVDAEASVTWVSDRLTAMKGTQGDYSPGTLRGGIAYAALSNCIDRNNQNTFNRPEYHIALDPIGMYRQLVKGVVESDKMHEQSQIPLLFYAGQAVHVPDAVELRRDLAILCDEEELHQIADKVLDRKPTP